MTRYYSFLLVFLVSSLITIFGVLLFFKPIESGDELRLVMPASIGLVYVFGCALLYMWAYSEVRSSYKAAAILTLPQIVLIIDLMLRGERGPLTALAGSILLIITWGATAFIHAAYKRKIT